MKRERAELIDRINRRVDLMMESGLKAEVEALHPHWSANALQTVGYREWDAFFLANGRRTTLLGDQARTRQFAKRQMTWFQKMEGVHWFHPDQTENIAEVLQECANRGWGPVELTQNHGE